MLKIVKILNFFSLILLVLLSNIFVSVYANTLQDVKDRGYLLCGVSENFIGFASPNDKGEWEGFDVDFCRAVAVAVFGDLNKVKFIPTTSRSRFPSLAYGEIDLLIRNTTWSYSRDTNLEFEFVGVNFYDGQTFMTPKNLEIKNVSELNGASICIVNGSSNEANIKNYFDKNSLNYTPVALETFNQCIEYYLDGKCDSFSGDLTVLAASRSKMPDSTNHSILTDIISKEPLGPLVRHGDNLWEDVVRWTLNVLILAEEKNLDSGNIDKQLDSGDAEIKRMLGIVGNYGDMLELNNDWAYNIIKQIGNYSSIYEKNIGINTVLGLERGLNNLWLNGGILYSPPYR